MSLKIYHGSRIEDLAKKLVGELTAERAAKGPFEILCGDARDNKANPNGCAVPPAGVIGYDFFANFTLVVNRLGEKMTFFKN